MRAKTLSDISGMSFDVVIVGGGISGASSAQHLAAEGYSVLLVEKDDYASAATSRSGRLLHCGLRYLSPAYSVWEFLRNPKALAKAVRAAHLSIKSSTEFIATSPNRQAAMTVYTTIDENSPYSGFHVDVGARFLQALNLNRQCLGYRRYSPDEGASLPYISLLRDHPRISSVVKIRDRQFHWPERICIDAVMDARRMGAVTLNYTTASQISQTPAGGWRFLLRDSQASNLTAEIDGGVFLNMAGAWIDDVNALSGVSGLRKKVLAVKGVHILVELPPAYRGQGFMGLNRKKEGLTCMPWGSMHFVGPTETLYDGNLDDVRPEEEDVEEILDEINYMLPGISLHREDVRQAWAGVRPITYNPDFPKGDRMAFSKLHDLSSDGLQNALTLTWAAIMFHRPAAREIVAAVKRKRLPTAPRQQPDFGGLQFGGRAAENPVVAGYDRAGLDDIAYCAEHEQPRGLVDILFRRLPLGWYLSLPPDAVERAASAAAKPLEWSDERTRDEIRKFREYVATYHLDDGMTAWRAG